MEESRKEKLLAAGVDVEAAMERFMGNEELLIRFLKKFPQDPNYGLLKTAIEEERYEDGFKAAHTMKGVCGNLSLIRLFEIVSGVVEVLRRKEYSQVGGMFPEITQEYDRVIKVLDTL